MALALFCWVYTVLFRDSDTYLVLYLTLGLSCLSAMELAVAMGNVRYPLYVDWVPHSVAFAATVCTLSLVSDDDILGL